MCGAALEEDTMTQEQPPIPDSTDPDNLTPDNQASEDQESVSVEEVLSATPEELLGEEPIGGSETFVAQDELPPVPSNLENRESLEDELSEASPGVNSEPLPANEARLASDRSSEMPLLRGSRDVQSQTLRSLQQFWQTTQPILKTGTITLLKGTIQVLEAAVVRLEADPKSSEETPSSQASPTASSPAPKAAPSLLTTLRQTGQQIWSWWNSVLPKIRTILPASINQKVSDQALTGAIVGLLIIGLWTTSSLISSKPPTQVATAPPSKSTPQAKPSDKTLKEPPTAKPLPEVKVTPPTATKPQPSPSPQASIQPSPLPTPKSSQSPTPSSQPATPTPKPSPAPPLKLTPEQKLIAQIQDQVAAASDQSVAGLIQSVQANFRASRLTVKVSRTWYTLPETQQNKIANDILQRAQQLNFVKLEMIDPQGILLARSPVVGSEMVILKPASPSLG